jgi:PAS domain S-box-containing protein
MPDSLIDLAGLNVDAGDFLAAVLQAAAQPVWVVDPGGVIRFANPAALAALGYDSAEELSGRGSHESIHHHHPDGTPYPAAECRMLLPRTTGETIESELDWFFRRDGSTFPVSYVSVPLEMAEGRGAVVAFNDIEDRLRAEQVLREHDAVLATEQASLRRIATHVAGGAATEKVFTAIAREVGRILNADRCAVGRYEREDSMTVVGYWSNEESKIPPGTRIDLQGDDVTAAMRETRRPLRIDNHEHLSGPLIDHARTVGPLPRSTVAAPIFVDGRVWGSIFASTMTIELPEGTESRVTDFAELVATTVANTASREAVSQLADEQAALRRVATLVAEGAEPVDVFAAVAEEVGRLVSIDGTRILRYEDDGTATVIAGWTKLVQVPPELEIGARVVLDGETVAALVFRSGRPARVDSYASLGGSLAPALSEAGIQSAVGAPIIVDGALWGVMAAGSLQAEPLPAGTEDRLATFTELVATAIANTESRAELAASRRRVVAASDEARRRIERDLHDGVQQRLVSLGFELRAVEAALPPDHELRAPLAQTTTDLTGALEDLVEIARGIHPAILCEGGLAPALKTLARRSAVPVELKLKSDRRLPESVEVAGYYVVSEALTNAAKHAHASVVHVELNADDSSLQLAIRDDGVGGADLDHGSGLVGLGDRVEALGGRIEVASPAGGGTSLLVRIPIGAG